MEQFRLTFSIKNQTIAENIENPHASSPEILTVDSLVEKLRAWYALKEKGDIFVVTAMGKLGEP